MNCPCRMFCHQRIAGLDTCLKGRVGLGACHVPQGDSHIPTVTGVSGAPYGRLTKSLTKCLGADAKFLHQASRSCGILSSQCGVTFGWGETIPWADHLAHITAEDPVAHRASQ